MSLGYKDYSQYLGAQRCCNLKGQGPTGPTGTKGDSAIGEVGPTGPNKQYAYGQFYSDISQNILTTETRFTFQYNDPSFDTSFNNTQLSVGASGTYKVSVVANVSNTTAPDTSIQFWLKRNNINIPFSSSTSSATTIYTLPCFEMIVRLDAGDHIQVCAIDRGTGGAPHIYAENSVPFNPSIRVTLIQIS
jgi:hypothetical protein